MTGVDAKLLAAARERVGLHVVEHLRELRAKKSAGPYDRIAAAEWFIWAETERRRVMPKGRGRPRKAAIV